MHALRLLYECKELLTSGKITLPRPEREFLIRLRTGKFSMDKVISIAQTLFPECEDAAVTSSLPEKLDCGAVSKLISDSYLTA